MNDCNDIRIYRKEIDSLLKKYFVHYIHSGQEANQLEKNRDFLTFTCIKKPRNVVERLKNLFTIFKKINKADVIHLHNLELLLLVPFLRIKYRRSKIIFDMHEDFEETIKDREWIYPFFRKSLAKLYKIYISFLMTFFLDYTIVTTPLIKKKFQKFKNVAIIENFAPLMSEDKRVEIPNDIMACINDNLNKTKLVFTGMINDQRGILKILEAVSFTEDTVLLLLGKYEGGIEEKIRRKSSELSIENRIFMFNSVDYSIMSEIIKRCDIGMLTYLPLKNHVVTRPNKLFEYMMCSIPIIASDFPMYREIVQRDCGWLVNPEDATSIQLAIEKYKNNPSLGKAYGQNGRKLYINEFNWSIEEKKLFSIYKEVLNSENDNTDN